MSGKETWTVVRMIEWATGFFTEKGVPSPRLSIEWLLADVLQTKRLNLYLQFDRPLSASELDHLREYVKRRGRHEPLQYITGHVSFLKATINVNPSVLIPRPETEELAQIILSNHPEQHLSLLDIGTGSGCIPISISLERKNWTITAVDLSKDALETARQNNTLNQTSVGFSEANLFDIASLPQATFDIIVSNPPYIHHDEKTELEPQVYNHEPALALFCENRFEVYAKIAEYAGKNLRKEGALYLELHEEHRIEDEAIFDDSLWDVTVLPDLNNKRRFVQAKRL